MCVEKLVEMDRIVYETMSRVQNKHWWFLGRKRAFSALISKLKLPKNSRILEIGAGTGANLLMLSTFGNVTACESDGDSRKFLEEAGWNILPGLLPNGLPGFKYKFDLICLFDVLEHIEDDVSSLLRIKDLLTPDGVLVVACPAYQWLYEDYDKKLGHFRRYTKTSLDGILKLNQFEIIESGYINTFLFPLVAFGRMLESLGIGARKNALTVPNKCINSILKLIFYAEAKFIKLKLFPFGVTVISVSRSINLPK